MKKNSIIGIIVVVFIAIIVWAVLTFEPQTQSTQQGNQNNQQNTGQTSASNLRSFQLEKPDLVAHGDNLGKVEIWALPTGTGITDKDAIKLGDAVMDQPQTEVQVWRMLIPKKEVLATQIFAKGYDKNGKVVGTVALPLTGATEIHNALWGNTTNQANLTIKMNEEKTVLGLAIKPLKVTEDSRCPQGVQCIWQGQVGIDVQLKAGTKVSTINILTTGENYRFENYSVTLVAVQPETQAGKAIDQKDYILTFRIQKI